ncbi:MAG: hypothetical protein ACP5H2_11395 [Solirubrobacteraceae bacterium]
MSWQQAILAGSWVCIQEKNESIAARRWLRVDGLLCRSVRSQARNPVTAAASIRSSVSFSGGTDSSSRN